MWRCWMGRSSRAPAAPCRGRPGSRTRARPPFKPRHPSRAALPASGGALAALAGLQPRAAAALRAGVPAQGGGRGGGAAARSGRRGGPNCTGCGRNWTRRGGRSSPLLALGDGGFDVVDLWRALPERTTLLARTACNRALYALPPADAHRNRRYGAAGAHPAGVAGRARRLDRTTLHGARAGAAAALPRRGAVRAPGRAALPAVPAGGQGQHRASNAATAPPPRAGLLSGQRVRRPTARGRCPCRPRSCWPGPGNAGKSRWRIAP